MMPASKCPEDQKHDENLYQLVSPNGGYGWWVSIGSAVINAFTNFFNALFGLLFGPYLQKMGMNTTQIALILNLSIVVVNLSGLNTGIVLKKFTPKRVAITGVTLIVSGLLICAFSESYFQIMFGYSLLVGLGQGLTIPSTFIALNSYFTTKKRRANGISCAGTAFGQMLMPNVVGFLALDYGFRETVLIIAVLALTAIAGACLYQPVEKHMKRVLIEDKIEVKKPKVLEEPQKLSFWERLINLMDLKLLTSFSFLNILFGLGMFFMINISFGMLLPFYLQETVKLTKQKTALCMSSIAAADLISRLTFPLLTERFKVSSRVIFLIGIVVMAFLRGILAELRSFYAIIGICIFYGYFRAFGVVNQNLSLSEHCAENCPERIPGALGLFMLSKGLFILCFGQLLGWIRDYFGSYALCLHIQNVFISIVIISWLTEILYKKFRT